MDGEVCKDPAARRIGFKEIRNWNPIFSEPKVLQIGAARAAAGHVLFLRIRSREICTRLPSNGLNSNTAYSLSTLKIEKNDFIRV